MINHVNFFHSFTPHIKRFKSVFLCLLLPLISNCSEKKLPVTELTIEREGQIIAVIKAEIAKTDEERAKGLMFRKNLPDGEGMLFVHNRDEILSFWMKNTEIPLTIAYIAWDGRIIDILNMYPHNTDSVKSSRAVRYALEVPQGWFSKVGVQHGDIVNISNL